jgi:arsenate reductase
MTTIYGIKNCDTMKKAFKWLDDNGVDYEFHDFKKAGLDVKQLKDWVKQLGWEALVNRRGLTWRKLPEAEREGITEAKAIKLMLANPSLVKRPVLANGKKLHVGFKPDEYASLFK